MADNQVIEPAAANAAPAQVSQSLKDTFAPTQFTANPLPVQPVSDLDSAQPGDIVTLTPEQQAEADKSIGIVNPIRDLSPDEMVQLKRSDPTFDFLAQAQSQPELMADPKVFQNVADAWGKYVDSTSWHDLPTPLDVGKNLASAAWGFLKRFGTGVGLSAKAAGESLATGENAPETIRGAGEQLAGTEAGIAGAITMLEHTAAGLARKTGLAKPLADRTPEQRAQFFADSLVEYRAQQKLLSGEGLSARTNQYLKEHGTPIRPEVVGEYAAGDPFSWEAMGKAFGLGAKAVKAPVGAALSKIEAPVGGRVVNAAQVAGATASAIGEKAESVAAATGGKLVSALAKGTEGAAKVVQKVAPAVGATAGAAIGATVGKEVFHGGGIVGGVAGFKEGLKIGKEAAEKAEGIGETAEKAGKLGPEISGEKPITSPYSQLAQDFFASIPKTAAAVGTGAALDLGMAAGAETPEESKSVGFGTGLGLLHGGFGAGKRILGGQLIGSRNFPIDPQKINDFLQQAAPGTKFIHDADPTMLKARLMAEGVAPETAELASQHNGISLSNVPVTDAQGKVTGTKRLIATTQLNSAPHELMHAIRNALPAEVNQAHFDKIKQAFSPEEWQGIGRSYAYDLDPAAMRAGADWREIILDKSSQGTEEAAKKVLADQLGRAPSPVEVINFVRENPGLNWRDHLTQSEAGKAADNYMSREAEAEHFAADFAHSGTDIGGGKSVPERIAKMISPIVSAFGGEPLAGRVSPGQQMPLKSAVLSQTRKTVKPLIAPAGEEHPAEAAETIPSTPANEAQKAISVAAKASDKPVAGAKQSAREILGTIAQKISDGGAVLLSYLGAHGDAPENITSALPATVRSERRDAIEEGRNAPDTQRTPWDKSFFPSDVFTTKQGKNQVGGWSPAIFTANARRLAKTLGTNPELAKLSPFEIDPATGFFTPDAWARLQQRLQTVIANHQAGRTGSGLPFNIPETMRAKGFFAPALREAAGTVPQGEADFINHLLGFKLPDTAVLRGGRYPWNLMAQEASQATLPGRVTPLVTAKPGFGEVGLTEKNRAAQAAAAARLGIPPGSKIQEVNPFRASLENAAAGKTKLPDMLEAYQRLNLDRIAGAEHAAGVPSLRGNTVITAAGFQPKRGEIKVTPEEDLKWFEKSGQPGYSTPIPETPTAEYNSHYWQSPSGNFYSADRYHWKWAREHVVGEATDAVERMTRNGWLRINTDNGRSTGTGKEVIVQGRPNKVQKDNLTEFSQNDESPILDDSGRLITGDEFYQPTQFQPKRQPYEPDLTPGRLTAPRDVHLVAPGGQRYPAQQFGAMDMRSLGRGVMPMYNLGTDVPNLSVRGSSMAHSTIEKAGYTIEHPTQPGGGMQFDPTDSVDPEKLKAGRRGIAGLEQEFNEKYSIGARRTQLREAISENLDKMNSDKELLKALPSARYTHANETLINPEEIYEALRGRKMGVAAGRLSQRLVNHLETNYPDLVRMSSELLGSGIRRQAVNGPSLSAEDAMRDFQISKLAESGMDPAEAKLIFSAGTPEMGDIKTSWYTKRKGVYDTDPALGAFIDKYQNQASQWGRKKWLPYEEAPDTAAQFNPRKATENDFSDEFARLHKFSGPEAMESVNDALRDPRLHEFVMGAHADHVIEAMGLPSVAAADFRRASQGELAPEFSKYIRENHPETMDMVRRYHQRNADKVEGTSNSEHEFASEQIANLGLNPNQVLQDWPGFGRAEVAAQNPALANWIDKNAFPNFDTAQFQPTEAAGVTSPAQVKRAEEAWRMQGTKSPFFQKWFRGSKAVDENGEPEIVFHGTTHNFDAFDINKAFHESDVGAGHYFSSERYDAGENYAGTGPDLHNRIENRAEQIMSESGDSGLSYGSAEYKAAIRRATEQAERDLVGTNPRTISAYLSLKNPVVFDLTGSQKKNTKSIWPEYNAGREMTQIPIDNALERAVLMASRENGVFDYKRDLWGPISEAANYEHYEDGPPVIDAYTLKQLASANGESPNLIRDIFRTLGFDGVKYVDASRHFRSKDGTLPEGTRHYVVWNPEQVKSTENRGTFSNTDPRIQFAPKAEEGKPVEQKPEEPRPSLLQRAGRAINTAADTLGAAGEDMLSGMQFAPSTDPRAVKMAAVKDKATDKVWTGDWHPGIRDQMRAEGHFKYGPRPLVDGFVTNNGEFLDREQAFERAKELQQVPKNFGGDHSQWLESQDFETARQLQPSRKQIEDNERAFAAGKSSGRNIPAGWWLDPSGNLHAAPEDHEVTAQRILNAPGMTFGQSSEQLYRRGWLRAADVNGTMTLNGLDGRPTTVTSAQRAALENLGIQHDLPVKLSTMRMLPDRVAHDYTPIYEPPTAAQFSPKKITDAQEEEYAKALRAGDTSTAQNIINTVESKLGVNPKVEVRPVDHYGQRRWTVFVDGDEKTNDFEELPGSKDVAEKAAAEAEHTFDLTSGQKDESGKVRTLREIFSASQFAPKKADEPMFRGEPRKTLSSAEVARMTKAQTAAHFPESVIPKKKDEKIPYDIATAPLVAGLKTDDAEKLYGKKITAEAQKYEDHPSFQAGLGWYSRFVSRLNQVIGKKWSPKFAELLAATSPQNNPTINYNYALDALEGFKAGHYDAQIKKYVEGLKMVENGTWEKWLRDNNRAQDLKDGPTEASFLGEWILAHDLKPRKANGLLFGKGSTAVLNVLTDRWLENTEGPKTRNFVANLIGSGHDATIDVWAARLMRRLGYAEHQERWRILPKNERGVTDPDFFFSQRAFAHAAKELGVQPDALQGALWFAEKELWAHNGWGRLDLGDFIKEMDKTAALKKLFKQQRAESANQPAPLVTARPTALP